VSKAGERKSAQASIAVLTRRSGELLARIDRDTTDEQRNWRPEPDAWSIVEIVQHIALATGSIFRTTRPASGRLRWTGAVKSALLTGVLRSRIKIRAPVPAIVPRPGVTWEEAQIRMKAAAARWAEFVASDSFDDTAFKHPLTGRITAAQTATFVVEHFDHHVRQIDRIFAKVAS